MSRPAPDRACSNCGARLGKAWLRWGGLCLRCSAKPRREAPPAAAAPAVGAGWPWVLPKTSPAPPSPSPRPEPPAGFPAEPPTAPEPRAVSLCPRAPTDWCLVERVPEPAPQAPPARQPWGYLVQPWGYLSRPPVVSASARPPEIRPSPCGRVYHLPTRILAALPPVTMTAGLPERFCAPDWRKDHERPVLFETADHERDPGQPRRWDRRLDPSGGLVSAIRRPAPLRPLRWPAVLCDSFARWP